MCVLYVQVLTPVCACAEAREWHQISSLSESPEPGAHIFLVGSQEGLVIFLSPYPKSTGVAGALLILVCFSFSFWTIARFPHTWKFSYG